MTPLLAALSCREESVVALLAQGFGEREIAERMGVTKWTVRAHVASGCRKLRASNRTHLVAIYVGERSRA